MRQDATNALADLVDAFPRTKIAKGTINVYIRELEDLPADKVALACRHLLRTSIFFPTIAEIRRQVAEQTLGLPTAEQAWGALVAFERREYHREHPPLLAYEILKEMGGLYALRSTEQPSIFRAQFLKLYADRREHDIQRCAVGELHPRIGAG